MNFRRIIDICKYIKGSKEFSRSIEKNFWWRNLNLIFYIHSVLGYLLIYEMPWLFNGRYFNLFDVAKIFLQIFTVESSYLWGTNVPHKPTLYIQWFVQYLLKFLITLPTKLHHYEPGKFWLTTNIDPHS